MEGWHTGQEWIDGGMLTERINFAVDEVGDAGKPGIQALIKRLRAAGDSLTPEQFVDSCLDLVGPLTVEESTRADLVRFAHSGGDLVFLLQWQRQRADRRRHRPYRAYAPTDRCLTRVPVRLTRSS